jgi:hypothetical protein
MIEGTHLEHWLDNITLERMLGADMQLATSTTTKKKRKPRRKKKTTTTTTTKKDSTM